MTSQPSPAKLRDRAERFLRQRSDTISQTPPEDIKKLIEELSIHQIEIELQNQELRRAQLEISLLRDKFEDLYEFIPVGYFVIDARKRIEEVNLTGCGMLGKNRSELKNSIFTSLIDPSNLAQFQIFYQTVLSSDQKQSCEIKLKGEDGHLFYARIEGVQILENSSEPNKSRLVVVNIDQQKQTEKELESALEEKDVLMHETHHRVKNNMAVINSLLNLQMSYISDNQAKDALHQCQNRIFAMSAVHEILHSSDSLTRINLKSYLSRISVWLLESSGVKLENIHLSIFCENIEVGMKGASTLGLVINELISNSLKHAFPDDREGDISIIVTRQTNILLLTASDNGVGLAENINWKASKTLGLNLITALVNRQLAGTIEFENLNGAKFTIKIDLNNLR